MLRKFHSHSGAVFTSSLLLLDAGASVVLVDSFDQHDLILPGNGQVLTFDNSVSTPIGTRRLGFIDGTFIRDGATLSAEFNSGEGFFAFSGSGIMVPDQTRPIQPARPVVSLSYFGDAPNSLARFSAFEFEFSELSGEGTIWMTILSTQGNLATVPVAITETGNATLSFKEELAEQGADFEEVTTVSFAFVSKTEEFAFTLDEIRLIPEPSISGLFALAAGGFLLRRRRASPQLVKNSDPNLTL